MDLYVFDEYYRNYNPILVKLDDGTFRPLTLEDVQNRAGSLPPQRLAQKEAMSNCRTTKIFCCCR